MQLSLRLGDDQLRFLLVVGLVTFGLLFVVYGKALQVAELSAVTFGWFVFLTVGILLLERTRYGVELSVGKWIAIVVVVVAQAYLILGGPTKG